MEKVGDPTGKNSIYLSGIWATRAQKEATSFFPWADLLELSHQCLTDPGDIGD